MYIMNPGGGNNIFQNSTVTSNIDMQNQYQVVNAIAAVNPNDYVILSQLSGGAVSLNMTGVDITASGVLPNISNATLKNTGTAGNYNNISTDAQGRVVSGSLLPVVNSVTNSDGTINISGTGTNPIVSLNPAHANTWSAVQTFNSGDIVASNITNTGILTLPTSTDTLIGKITTDTLQNKTLTNHNNVISASQLMTTGSDVIINTAAPPIVGQVLTAINATSASWQSPIDQINVTGDISSGGLVTLPNVTLTLPNVNASVTTAAFNTANAKGLVTAQTNTAPNAISMNSFQINNLATPSVNTDAANKSYVDSYFSSGINATNVVKCNFTNGVATNNDGVLIASDIPNLDTSKLTTGLLPDSRGGINVDSSAFTGVAHVNTGVWTASPIVNNDITNATIQASTKLSATGVPSSSTVLYGNDTWGTIPSGNINVTGSDFTMSGVTGTAITNGLLNNVATAGTNTKLTYNAKGLVTSGVQAVLADIGTTGSSNQQLIYNNAGTLTGASTIFNNVNGDLTLGVGSHLILQGSTSGNITLSSDSTDTSYTLTLPTAVPTKNNQALCASTTGVGVFKDVALNNGNTLGGQLLLGTLDANNLALMTNATAHWIILSAGGALQGQGNVSLQLTDTGSNHIGIRCPTTVTSSYNINLPPAIATSNNNVLTSSTLGVCSWTTPSISVTGGDFSMSGSIDAVTNGTLNNVNTAGTYTSVTTNAKGLVTSGSNPVVVQTVTNSDASITVSGTVANPIVSLNPAHANTWTNQTLTSNTNTIRSTQLATTTSDVVLSSAIAPTIGQILTATSSTAANWQTPSAAPTNFDDTIFYIYDHADNTKRVYFNTSGLPSSAIITLNIPNLNNSTIATLANDISQLAVQSANYSANNFKITALLAPSAPTDAANKNYVDSQFSSGITTTGFVKGNVANGLITSSSTLSSGDIPNLPGSIITSSFIGTNYGGTGINSSGLTGVAHINAGTWSASNIVNSDITNATIQASVKLNATGLNSSYFLRGDDTWQPIPSAPTNFDDTVFYIYDHADNTKQLKFNTSALTPSTVMQWNIPANTGSPNYVLQTDGNNPANLSWVAQSGGGATLSNFLNQFALPTTSPQTLIWGINGHSGANSIIFGCQETGYNNGLQIQTTCINASGSSAANNTSVAYGLNSTFYGFQPVFTTSENAGNPKFTFNSTGGVDFGNKPQVNMLMQDGSAKFQNGSDSSKIFKFSLNNQTTATNITWTLPSSNGTSGYVLSTDGSTPIANLSWIANGSGSASIAYSNLIYVDSVNGLDSYTGTNVKPYATIGKAIMLAGYGVTIMINPGTYNEYLNLNQNFTYSLVGNGQGVIIDNTSNGLANVIQGTLTSIGQLTFKNLNFQCSTSVNIFDIIATMSTTSSIIFDTCTFNQTASYYDISNSAAFTGGEIRINNCLLSNGIYHNGSFLYKQYNIYNTNINSATTLGWIQLLETGTTTSSNGTKINIENVNLLNSTGYINILNRGNGDSNSILNINNVTINGYNTISGKNVAIVSYMPYNYYENLSTIYAINFPYTGSQFVSLPLSNIYDESNSTFTNVLYNNPKGYNLNNKIIPTANWSLGGYKLTSLLQGTSNNDSVCFPVSHNEIAANTIIPSNLNYTSTNDNLHFLTGGTTFAFNNMQGFVTTSDLSITNNTINLGQLIGPYYNSYLWKYLNGSGITFQEFINQYVGSYQNYIYLLNNNNSTNLYGGFIESSGTSNTANGTSLQFGIIDNNSPTTVLSLDEGASSVYTINAHTHKITNVVDPVSAQDAATKNYVDTHIPSPGLTEYMFFSDNTTDTLLAYGSGMTINGNTNSNNIFSSGNMAISNSTQFLINLSGIYEVTYKVYSDISSTSYTSGLNTYYLQTRVMLYNTSIGNGVPGSSSLSDATYSVLTTAATGNKIYVCNSKTFIFNQSTSGNIYEIRNETLTVSNTTVAVTFGTDQSNIYTRAGVTINNQNDTKLAVSIKKIA